MEDAMRDDTLESDHLPELFELLTVVILITIEAESCMTDSVSALRQSLSPRVVTR
jgi:hypothetical protein